MDMAEVPNLRKYGSVGGTSKEWNTSCLSLDGILELGKGIRRGVRRGDPSSVKKNQISYTARQVIPLTRQAY